MVEIDTLRIGDTVRLFLDSDGGNNNSYRVVSCQEDITPKSTVLLATIIRQDKKDTIAHFVVGFTDQIVITNRSSKMDVNREFIGATNLTEKKPTPEEAAKYANYVWLRRGWYIELVSSRNGVSCVGKYCPAPYNQYAQPNQPNGSFLCYECRQLPTCMR